jgi:hypothetical protein
MTFRMTKLDKLAAKLCRELAQSEHSALVHPRREAKRLGDVLPAHALLAIAEHAEHTRPRLEAILKKRGVGHGVGQSVGSAFSAMRHALFDRMIDKERSYRGTLLGFHHGIDILRLLREVALRREDTLLVKFCDELLIERLALIERAEQALAFFADEPALALA